MTQRWSWKVPQTIGYSWDIGTFEYLAATVAEELPDEDEIRTDFFFRNDPDLISYETFIGVITGDEQTALSVRIAMMET